MEIIESYLKSKKGEASGGEDRLIIGPNFYGVVDGATDKSGNNWGTKDIPRTGGDVLADIVKQVLENPETNTEPDKIVEIINQKIHSAAKKADIDLSIVNNQADVGFIAYVLSENAIYYIHDCNFAFLKIDGTFETHYNDKEVDKITSALRTVVINWYKEQGIDPFENNRDLGRDFILPLLKRQPELQNLIDVPDKDWAPGIPYKLVVYKTLNGFPTNLNIIQVPEDTKEIILASDGFKVIKQTLLDTLENLNKQLTEDPYCINVLQSTKGLKKGNISFDDMSYLRLKI